MADINVEQKRRGGILPWLLGLLGLLLLIWLLTRLLGGRDDDGADPVVADSVVSDTAYGPVTPVPVAPIDSGVAVDSGAAAGTAGAGGALPVAQILAGPRQYSGQTLSGTARVTEVVSDHGFWVEDAGQRLFVALGEKAERAVEIRTGQTVRLSGTVHTGADAPAGIDPEARTVISSQPAFMYVRQSDVAIDGQNGGNG